MPSLTAIFSNNNSQKKCCCTCGCHVPAPINTAIAQEQSNINSSSNSSIILSPTRWFPRIRRRSSSSSSASSIDSVASYISSDTFGNHKDELNARLSADSRLEIDNETKQLNDFQNLYKLAVDEIAYAIESQGSIYYNGDLLTATEAVNDCLSRYQVILQSLKEADRSYKFQQEWTDTLILLRSRLDNLPSADSL